MFMPFHLIKTYIRNPETETKLFLCPSTSSDTDGCAADMSVNIYARGGSFFELGINDNLEWKTVGEYFFCFCQQNKKSGLLISVFHTMHLSITEQIRPASRILQEKGGTAAVDQMYTEARWLAVAARRRCCGGNKSKTNNLIYYWL